MPPTGKLAELEGLGAKRRDSPVPTGCFALRDFHNGYYECEFVSPWTISARNTEAELALVLQDWCGSDYLARPVRPLVKELGHDPDLPTNRNLKHFLSVIGLELKDVFGTNAFPWIKAGKMNGGVERNALCWAFRELVIPQILTVKPKVAVLFGKTVNDAACDTFKIPRKGSLAEAIGTPIDFGGITYATVAHTGSKIHLHRGWDNSAADWRHIGSMLR